MPSAVSMSWSTIAVAVPATVSSPYRGPYATLLATISATLGPGISINTVTAAMKGEQDMEIDHRSLLAKSAQQRAKFSQYDNEAPPGNSGFRQGSGSAQIDSDQCVHFAPGYSIRSARRCVCGVVGDLAGCRQTFRPRGVYFCQTGRCRRCSAHYRPFF